MPSLEGMGIMTPRVLGMPKDEAWARVSRVPTPRLIDLIFETIDSDCDKLLARREIRFSPFGLKLAKHWKALDLKSERTFSLREWHQFFDELRDELGREFDDFIVELVWHADVDVTHLLPLDFGGTPRPMATSSTVRPPPLSPGRSRSAGQVLVAGLPGRPGNGAARLSVLVQA